MERSNVGAYVWFGTCIRYLQDVDTGWYVGTDGGALVNIDGFFDWVDRLGLKVTGDTRAFMQLNALRDELRQDLLGDPDRMLTPTQSGQIKQAMHDVRKTLEAELHGMVAYVPTDKRLDVGKLQDDVRALVTADTYDKISGIAQLDLDEAGKCIAFDRPTASAFHLMRATEQVLREFYLSIVKRNRIAPPLMWGPMVTALEGRSKPPPSPILENLTNIRRSFRNPTQHPDKVYDLDEAQDLFALSVDAIRRMSVFL